MMNSFHTVIKYFDCECEILNCIQTIVVNVTNIRKKISKVD